MAPVNHLDYIPPTHAAVRFGIHDCNPGPRLYIKTVFARYRDSHVKDKTVERPSYL